MAARTTRWDHPRRWRDYRLLPVLLFGLSFVLLAYEVVLLRILTYLQWYHFAYLVISLALLGFGASGTLLHLFRPFWHRHLDDAFTWALLLAALFMAAMKPILTAVPMDSFLAVWQPWRLGGLVLLCLVLFLPFFSGAFGLILVFSSLPGRIGWYYGANLVGSGTGALGGLLLLYLWHPLDIPSMLALGMGALGLVQVARTWLRRRPAAGKLATAFPILGLAAVVLLVWLAPGRPGMSPYKALSYTRLMPGTEMVSEDTGPLGILTIVRGPTMRSATGLSLSYQGEIRPQAVAYLDGNPIGALPLPDDTSPLAPLRHTTFTLPYRIRSFDPAQDRPFDVAQDRPLEEGRGHPRRALVLNAGTGSEVHQALMEGCDSVVAVVRHRRLLEVLQNPALAGQGLNSIYLDERVEVTAAEPRSYLYRESGTYDVVMLPPVGGVVGAAAAVQAVHEDNLLTREGMAAMIGCLSPEGMLCLTTWLDNPSRRPLKLFALLAAGLTPPTAGLKDMQGPSEVPGHHLAAVGSWNTFTAVLSRRPWTEGERDRIREFADEEGFDLLYLPGLDSEPPEQVYHHLADTTMVSALAALAEVKASGGGVSSPFHLDPPTDNRPFFHHFLTLRALPLMRHTLGTAGVMLAEWGYVLVWVTLALLIVGGGGLILVPLWLSRSARGDAQIMEWSKRSGNLSLLYFAAIGCGFMLIEIVLIQRLVLVLGDPVFATAAVITALLVFAGAGSILSGRMARRVGALVQVAAAMVVVLLALLFRSVSWLAPQWTALGVMGRFGIVVAALAPLAVVMGTFFPMGIRRLDATRAEHLIPWAWGVNGFASVVTTPVATLAALNLGFPAVGAAGACCYLLAAAIAFRWRSRRQANQPAPPASPRANSHQG